MANFKEKMERFSTSITELAKQNSIPKWFKPFIDELKTFSKDLQHYFVEEEGKLAIQKTVPDQLAEDRRRLLKSINDLEDEIEDQQQYSRRNCLLVHGIQEKPKEDVEGLVMDVLENKLQAGVTKNQISRVHRIGKKRTDQGKPRSIIMRFVSYRDRKRFSIQKKS